MNSEEKSMKGCLWVLICFIALSFVLNIVLLSRNHPEPSVVIEHDTVWKDTTIYEPQPAETINTGKTVYAKVPVPEYLPGDTIHDSIEVPVPIYQKRYDDSLYTAWVSGFRPNLDSIRLHFPEITTTITNTVYQDPPRLTLGIQAGVGYGIVNRKPDMYIGIGGTLRIGKNNRKR